MGRNKKREREMLMSTSEQKSGPLITYRATKTVNIKIRK